MSPDPVFPSRVRIVEVGPRDGLQNEPEHISVENRAHLVEGLAASGLTYIECGSFVSSTRVPQMAETEAVFQRIARRAGVTYSALVPNVTGLTRALACNVGEIAIFVSASEEFSHANLGCSIQESLQRSEQVARAAREQNLSVRGYISCVMGCPFSGAVPVSQVVSVADSLYRIGCREISLGDTIGTGTPLAVRGLVQAVADRIPLDRLAVHFHDTWGQALVNIYAALEAGIAVIDSSVAGLGGCPYAPGATGNAATEDVVYMLRGMGIETGVNLEQLTQAAEIILTVLKRKPASKAAQALRAARARP